jgi:hypothetical protein
MTPDSEVQSECGKAIADSRIGTGEIILGESWRSKRQNQAPPVMASQWPAGFPPLTLLPGVSHATPL